MNATSEEDEWVYSNKEHRSDDSPNEMTDENVEMINNTVPERQHLNRSYQTIDEVDAAHRSVQMVKVEVI